MAPHFRLGTSSCRSAHPGHVLSLGSYVVELSHLRDSAGNYWPVLMVNRASHRNVEGTVRRSLVKAICSNFHLCPFLRNGKEDAGQVIACSRVTLNPTVFKSAMVLPVPSTG
jgi:hypothetical protein